jgi:protease II
MVDQWRARVSLFLEDDYEQLAHKELFKAFILEGSLFKFEVDLTDELQRKQEFIEWHAKVKKVHKKIFEEEEDKIEEENEEVISLQRLKELVKRGEEKGFHRIQLREIRALNELC